MRPLIPSLLAALALAAAPALASDDDRHGDRGKSGKSSSHHSKGKRGHSNAFPETIALPDGWRPEGIAAGPGNSLFVGSIPTGSIIKLDARTGARDVVVERTGRAAIGIKYDDNRIYVAGGPTGRAFVYDATTGADVANVQLTTASPTFVNDVTLTQDFAYFTDSRQQQLYRLDRETLAATTIPITGDLQYDADPDNNEANGIAATKDGKTLYVVNGSSGKLFTVDPATGASKEVPITNGNLEAGDGLLLKGKTIFVVQNRLNQIAVVDLKRNRIAAILKDDDFDVPTTLAKQAGALYAPNARFGTATPTPDTATYNVVRVGDDDGKKKNKRRGRHGHDDDSDRDSDRDSDSDR
jgi:DNA-binding beta-propeller fold protein YncE